MTKVTQGQSSRNWVYGPNINFQFCCVTNIPTISTSYNNKHICSSNSVGWLGVGQGLAGVALFCSMCLSSGGLSQACSPGTAEKQESKGKHARPQKVQSQNWHNVNSASFSWLKKVTWRASLVAQWLRICLLMQGTRVRALVWEDPTCHGAAGPVSHNY